MTNMHKITQEQIETIIQKSKPVNRIEGIYFLIKNKEIVYVGQSNNIVARVGSHLSDKTKSFDSYSFVEISRLNEVESYFIHNLRPEFNRKRPCGKMCAPIPYEGVSPSRSQIERLKVKLFLTQEGDQEC